MKITFCIVLFICTSIVFTSCGKDKVDNRNRSLINIPLNELKTIIAGNWLLKKERLCGVAGCFTTSYQAGQEDLFSFLPLDSVKRVRYDGVVLVYGKATIFKSNYDSSWVYSVAGGLTSLSFQKISNDTLILDPHGQGSEGYLVRKP